jgi:hypothetical protein
MKKIIFLFTIVILMTSYKAKAQVYGPNPYYTGFTTLYFPTGIFYGYVINGRAEGIGTYYTYDGSFFQGNFSMGFQNGPGVAFLRAYGYVVGCWNGGQYIGICYNGQNPYNSPQAVQNVVYNVQQSVVPQINQNPQTTTPVPSYNPTAYNVTQIDNTTQLGKQIISSVKN